MTLNCAKVNYGSVTNIGQNQYGAVLNIKKKVMIGSNKSMNKYGLYLQYETLEKHIHI
jgi:hypothetical protein